MKRAGDPQFVLDCSVAMSWCFKDENDPYAMAVLGHIQKSCAIVPSLWRVEIINVILVAERRRRIDVDDSIQIVDFLSDLPIVFDEDNNNFPSMEKHLNLARHHSLTAYDATYLELAKRVGLPLATLDQTLIKAARTAGVDLFKI